MSTDDNITLEELGVYLLGEREKRGYTKRDLALKTKIPLEQLSYIEDGQLLRIRPVFAKGFLRAYANELGLDAEDILHIYRELTETKNENKITPLSTIYQNTAGYGKPNKFFKILGLLLLLLVIVTVLYFKVPFVNSFFSSFFAKNPEQQALTTQPSDEASTEASSVLVDLEEGAGENNILETTESDLPREEISSNEIAEAIEDDFKKAESASISSQIIGEGGILELSFYKNAWVELNIEGEPSKFLNFKAGDNRVWEIPNSATLIAKPLNAFKVKWNNKDLGYLGDHSVGRLSFPIKDN